MEDWAGGFCGCTWCACVLVANGDYGFEWVGGEQVECIENKSLGLWVYVVEQKVITMGMEIG